MFNKRFFINLARLKKFLKGLRLEPVHLLIPSLFALGASLFEGVSLSLLVPTMKGLMSSDFQFIHQLPVLGKFITSFPQIFLDRNSAIFALLIFLIFASAILKNVLGYFSSIMVSKQVRDFSHELRCIIFQSYVSFRKSFFDTNSTGHLQNVLIGYTEQIASQFKQFHNAMLSLFLLIVYLTIMMAISWKVTIFTAVVFPPLILLFQNLIGGIQRDSGRFTETFSNLGKKISNALSCMPLVKASCAENKENMWFADTSKQVSEVQVNLDRRTLLLAPAHEIYFLAMLILLMGFMAYLIVRQKEGDLSSFLVFFILIRRSMVNVGSLASLQGSVASVMGPLREVLKTLEKKKEFQEESGILPFLKFKDKIEFRHLSFSYIKNRQVLKNVSFEIKKGEMVALVGHTGSGKSTIAQLLMRFYDPPKGTLYIDGQDIRDFFVGALRKKIAYVSQENYLFDASILDNLKYACLHEPSEFEIWNALEKARLSELVKKLPSKLNTQIGERGVQLSGGEKQRLSLARAILRDPEILILDEATSGLDSRTEKLVHQAIAEVIKSRTAIIIAHRLSTIQSADNILVFDQGNLAESGNFSQLMHQKHFKKHWDIQMASEHD